ncbi:MAG: choice-of-anchor E domain-containing protein [Terrimicrobiaceae bacterium]
MKNAVLAGLAAALLATSATAATVSFSDTQLVDGSGVDFYLGKFNASLGILTGVSINVYSESTGSFTIYNTSGAFSARVKNLTDSLLMISNQGGMSDFQSSSITLTTNPSTAGLGDILPASTSRVYDVNLGQILVNNTVINISSGSWTNYQSPSGAGTVRFSAANGPGVTVTGATYSADTTSTKASTTLTVTYTYDAVPEPATIGLLAFAGGVILLAVRRRRA